MFVVEVVPDIRRTEFRRHTLDLERLHDSFPGRMKAELAHVGLRQCEFGMARERFRQPVSLAVDGVDFYLREELLLALLLQFGNMVKKAETNKFRMHGNRARARLDVVGFSSL